MKLLIGLVASLCGAAVVSGAPGSQWLRLHPLTGLSEHHHLDHHHQNHGHSKRAHFVENPIHRLTVALKQRNLDTLHSIVERVSDIESPQYGSYLSVDEIASLVAPRPEVIEEVTQFFLDNGAHSVSSVLTKDFLVVDMPVSAIESSLSVRFHRFSHRHSGRIVHRTTDKWSLPESISKHVDLITGLSDFFEYPNEIKLSNDANSKKSNEKECPLSSAPELLRIKNNENSLTIPFTVKCFNGNTTSDAAQPCSDQGDAVTSFTVTITMRSHPAVKQEVSLSEARCSVASTTKSVTCLTPKIDVPAWARLNISVVTTYADNKVSDIAYLPMELALSPFVVPDVIYERYDVPENIRGTHPANSIAVPGFEEQYISLADLKAFHDYVGLEYIEPDVVGQNDESNPGGESTLDISYIMGVAPGVHARFQSVTGPGPAIPPGQGAYILEWALQIANDTNAPLVTSISYGDTEDGYFNKFGDFSYIYRMDVELAKMAARGLTVLAGSGDAGASNVGEAGNDISPTDPTCTPFRPFYPSNSKYVTSVSSTFLTADHLPICHASVSGHPIDCMKMGESAVSVRDGIYWTTGGGFSNMSSNPTASWQKDFVSKYLDIETASGTLPPSNVFNAGGRAYPDVSTIGHNLLMVLNGALTTVDGTSASGPVMAGLVALLNDARLNAGLPSLGFINPFLYSAKRVKPEAFRDVVVGSNRDGDVQARCSPYATFCPYGFYARPGWDAVTGLGTPNFSILRDLALNTQDLADQHKRLRHLNRMHHHHEL